MIINYTINRPIDAVYNCLADMQQFCAVHPVIYKVDDLGNNQYTFYEKISLFSFSYGVTLEKAEPVSYVAMYSKVQSGVYLWLYFTLKTEGGVTHVQEEVVIKAPPVIKQVFASVLKNAHEKLFDAIGCV